MDWRINVRGAGLGLLDEISDYADFTATARFNRQGVWQVTLDALTDSAADLTWGSGVVVFADDDVFLSGPVVARRRIWDADSGEDKLVVTGISDDGWLDRRICFPEAPAFTDEDPGADTQVYDIRTGAASSVMGEYVYYNLGAGASASRRVTGLQIADDAPLGATVTGRGRWQPVRDILTDLALSGGDLGFQIAQDGAALMFSVYQPADRTRTVIFNSELGSVASYEYDEEEPTANWVVAAGMTDPPGPRRHFLGQGDHASMSRYGLIEKYVDGGDAATTELPQLADQALTEGAATVEYGATPIDTDALTFGRDYGLGDRVTVVVDGYPAHDVIREVTVALTEADATVTPVVGTPGAADPRATRIFNRLAALQRRVLDIERRT